MTNKGLHIGDGLTLPLDAVTESIAILAVRRAGKSNAAVVMAEEMHRNNLHWIAIDPKSDWWGVRSSKDGSGPGLPVVIFGGQHGDVPLEPTSGAMIADLIIDKRISCVLDVSGFESEAAKIRFLLAFGDRLFRRKDRNQDPTHVFFEEVDDYCPQRPFHEQARLVHVMARILKQGGSRGLGGTIISQRSAVVNKDLLTQVQTLFALRTTSPQDRKAIQGWVSMFGENEKIIESLPKLADGEAWVWSPNWLRKTEKFQFRRRSTYDSGSTPKVGASRLPTATLADIDLDSIKSQMADTIKRADDNDPTKLKKRVAELERQLATKQPVAPVAGADSKRVLALEKEIESLKSSLIAEHAETGRIVTDIHSGMLEARGKFNQYLDAVKALDLKISRADDIARRPLNIRTAPPTSATVQTMRTVSAPIASKPISAPGDSNLPGVSAPQQRMVDALSMLEGIGIVTVSHPVLAILSDQSPTSSGMDKNVSTLRSSGYIAGSRNDLTLTDQGRRIARVCEQRSLSRFHATWCDKVSDPQARMIRVLIEIYPGSIERQKLADRSGQSNTSSGFDKNLSRLRTLGVVEKDPAGHFVASDLLFPEGLG